MANHLATATSPYLREHADNLIEWWPWGCEALAEAARRDVPLLISIGYSACHWCHVMAAESFSDPAVAGLVNAHFVPIMVDREERPAVDQVFMMATQALTGQGGWPMTVFATPGGRPFFAGTYYPPVPQSGQPSFTQVCQAMAEAWHARRDEVLASGETIAAELARINAVPTDPDQPDLGLALRRTLDDVDVVYGGFGASDGPKFPSATLLDALLASGGPAEVAAVQQALVAMIRGGIHDQVGGGFHRYAVDGAWELPHFEKLLPDNALLLGTVARCWRRTGLAGDDSDEDAGPALDDMRDLLQWAAEGIVEWASRDLLLGQIDDTDPVGLAASLDADSLGPSRHAEEGAYYLWSPAELDQALGKDSRYIQGCCHVTMTGNMTGGRSTLLLHGDPDPTRFRRLMGVLRNVRDARPAPKRDDKRVACWNALAVISLVDAGMVFRKPAWLELARRLGVGLWAQHGFDGESPSRTIVNGQRGPRAVAEDYGATALAFTRLAGAFGDQEWLSRADHVLNLAVQRFSASDGGFFDDEDASDGGGPFMRPRQLTDEPTPSATSLLVAALRQGYLLTGNLDYANRADAASRTIWPTIATSPRFAGWGLLDAIMAQPFEPTGSPQQGQQAQARQEARGAGADTQVVIVTPTPPGQIDDLTCAAYRLAPEGSALVVTRPATDGFGGLLAHREAIGGVATAYICHGEVCLAPITDWSVLRAALASVSTT